MRRWLAGFSAVLLCAALLVVLVGASLSDSLDSDRPTPTTTRVVRGQANEPSRLESGWRLPNGHCTFTSPELAEQVGAVRDPACDR